MTALSLPMRFAPISVEHVVAEMIAHPYASEAALRACVTRLDPRLAEPETVALWRAAEHDIVRHPAFSLEELLHVRDRAWFLEPGDPAPVPLARHLRRLAGESLDVRGPVAHPRTTLADRPGFRDRDARWSWRWLSLAMPPDLVLAASGDLDRPAPRLDALSPSVARRLAEDGFGETHAHLGACLGFPAWWAAAQGGLASARVRPDAWRSPGAALDEGRDLGRWMLRAALARYVLAAYLSWGWRQAATFEAFCDGPLQEAGRATTRDDLTGPALQAVAQLLGGSLRPEPSEARLGDALRRLTGMGAPPRIESPEEIARLDPVWPLLHDAGPDGFPETALTRRALRHMATRQEPDVAFERAFWQCVRVRGLVYRHVTQRPLTPGLQWFIRFYSRISARGGGVPPETMLRAALRQAGLGQGLRFFEARTSPDPTLAANLRWARAAHALAKETAPDVEVGLVLHFTKERDRGATRQGRPAAFGWASHEAPSVINRMRFSNFYASRREAAYAWGSLLQTYPLTLYLVRGVDACTDELGVPTWVLSPLFRYVHRSADAARTACRERLGVEPLPMRTTVHVGEDFVHLLGGLRRVAEAITHLNLTEGDRLGHAMALGVNAREWASRAGRVPMNAEDRLLDLAWEWQCYARDGVPAPAGRDTHVRDALEALANEVFEGVEESPLDARTILAFVRLLHDESTLRRLGWPHRASGAPPRDLSPAERLVEAHLTDPDVHRRGRRLFWVDATGEVESLEAIQDALRQQVARRGLTVEINPSSNLLIGNLGDFANHPLWRLHDPRARDDASMVRICVGADDPITFATDLRNEHQLMYDALISGGLSSADALAFVERVRRHGFDARFTVSLPPLLRSGASDVTDLVIHDAMQAPVARPP